MEMGYSSIQMPLLLAKNRNPRLHCTQNPFAHKGGGEKRVMKNELIPVATFEWYDWNFV